MLAIKQNHLPVYYDWISGHHNSSVNNNISYQNIYLNWCSPDDSNSSPNISQTSNHDDDDNDNAAAAAAGGGVVDISIFSSDDELVGNNSTVYSSVPSTLIAGLGSFGWSSENNKSTNLPLPPENSTPKPSVNLIKYHTMLTPAAKLYDNSASAVKNSSILPLSIRLLQQKNNNNTPTKQLFH
jgi:hypothetical protein